MSSTQVNVSRDEDGNVVAHWTGTVTFDPSIYGDPGSFGSLINECVEDFTTELQSGINANFTEQAGTGSRRLPGDGTIG
jgi:hypothetical protein